MSTRARAARVVVAFVVTSSCLVTVAAASVVGNRAPSNVLSPRGASGPAKLLSDTFLQGWGFFTRDAREDRVAIAVDRGGGWRFLDHDATTTPGYLFGLSRLSRAQSIDINALYSAVPISTSWVDCEHGQDLESCLAASSPLATVSIRPVRQDAICNSDVALVVETPVPYAYRDLTRERITRVARIKVNCL